MQAAKTIQLSAGPIRYVDRGSGPPVVFVHGLLVDGRLWRKVTPLLEGRMRCIVPDLPLGSHSTPMNDDADLTPRGVARLIDDFLEALELRDVTLVGNDTGGAISQLLVTDRPDRVGALVLTPCDAFEDFFPPLFRGFQLLARTPPLLTATLQTMRVRALRRLPIAFGWLTKRPIPDEVVDAWMQPYLSDRGIRRDTLKLLRGVDKRDTLEAADRLRDFDRPALVAWASEDRVFKPENGRRLAEILPQGRFESIDDSYSFVPEDQPERLAELIASFVGERSGTPAA
jgi:pimeloyl-ACP methyl ester carboxylesterase